METELDKLGVHLGPECPKNALFDLENVVRISSMRNAMQQGSTKVEAVDFEHVLKKHESLDEFVRSYFEV